VLTRIASASRCESGNAMTGAGPSAAGDELPAGVPQPTSVASATAAAPANAAVRARAGALRDDVIR
jgi:hypothetical protein